MSAIIERSDELDTQEIANHLVAHELTNIMSALLAQSEQQTRLISRLAPLALIVLANGATYMREPELLELDAILEAHRTSLRLSLALDVDLELRLLARHNKIRADANLLRALFSNFAINAGDALKDVKDLRRKNFRIETLAIDGEILIQISDNGAGMTDETRARIEKGEQFSTKGTGHCGEGMTYISKIIRGLGGRVKIKSEIGIGTTFKIFLPTASI